MKKHRVGVIGTGYLGRRHAAKLARMRDVVLEGVCDLDLRRASAVADAAGSRVFASASALLARVDAVVIAVPAAWHAELTMEALEAGVSVLVEKPLATSLEDAAALVRAARHRGLILAVGHVERFNPALTCALPFLEHPARIDVRRLGLFSARGAATDIVLEVMIHDLDILIDRLGMPAGVATLKDVNGPSLHHRRVVLTWAEGSRATVVASRIAGCRERVIAWRSAGRFVHVDLDIPRVHWRRVDLGRVVERDFRPSLPGDAGYGDPLDLELRDFVDALRLDRQPRIPGVEGLRAMTLACRILEGRAASFSESPECLPGEG